MTDSVTPDPPADDPDWTLETNLRATHDLEGRLLAVSAAAAQALGFKREDLLKIPIRDLVDPAFLGKYHSYLDTIRRKGVAHGLVGLRTSAGAKLVWEYRNVLHERSGVPIVIGAAHDVTEHVLSRRILRASEGRFATAFYASPIAMAITTLSEGRYVDVNEAFERQMGYTRAEILGRTSLELNVWPSPAHRVAMITALQREKSLRRQDAEFRTKTGRLITTVYSAGLVTFDGERCVLAAILDNTAQKLAEDALRESEAKFRLLVETTRYGIFIYHEDGALCYFNPPVEVFTGYSANELRVLTVWDLIHPDFRDLVRTRAQARFRGEDVPSRSELKIISKAGEVRWLDVAARLIQFQAKPALMVTAFDITDREKAGFEIQRSLLLGQETERKRIARELHDDISQRLAIVGLTLSEVERLSPEVSPALETRLRALRQHVNSIAHDIHRISHNLHPSTLVDLGLVSALRGLCREFSDQRRVAVQFSVDVASAQASQEVAITLYRITQECLANVAMHSGSREARVHLTERSGALHLTIADTGVGFDARRLQPKAGLGLVSIRERARLIGANLQITSAPVRGTKVELRVPLVSADDSSRDHFSQPES
jgi:PAS domain S-box-containing protein